MRRDTVGSARARGSDKDSVPSAHRASRTFLRCCVELHDPQAGLGVIPTLPEKQRGPAWE